MPNPWTGKGNPYTREEVRARLQATLDRGNALIAAGAGTGISAKFIEKGGAAQIPDELDAYNPLVPNGHELTATFMIEIDDPIRRKNVLARLGGIEETVFITIGDQTVKAAAEADQDRTREDGKASTVQFVHFPFTRAQIDAFRAPGAQVILGLKHPNYSHMAVISEAIRAELSRDFD